MTSSIQTHDVELNGSSFMVLPGSYRSYPDGNLYVDSRLQRQVLTDFSAGMAGPKAGSRMMPAGGLYGQSSLGAWPAPWPVGVHGIGPAPARITTTLDTGGVPAATVRIGGDLFIGAGTNLYRYRISTGALTLRRTMDHPILDMAAIGSALFVAFGPAANIGRWVDSTSTWTANPTGNQLRLVRSIGLRMAGNEPDDNTIRIYGSNLASVTTSIDGPVINGTIHDDAVILATERSIWAFQPTSNSEHNWSHWGVVSSDGMFNPDDFVWMETFQGRLMTWQGGRAVLYDRQRGWWRHAGLEGAESYGAAVVNGWLIVAVRPRGQSVAQLWGYNGSGWWLMAEGDYRYLAAASGSHLLAWEHGSGIINVFNMDVESDPSLIADEITVDSVLLDGNAPDSPKFWTRVGVELARANLDAVGEWEVQLWCSLDAGASWIAAGSPTSNDRPVVSLSAPVGAESSWLRVRVTMVQGSGLPPHIMALWAEYEVFNESIRRRRWQFKVAATDRVLDRTGGVSGNGEDIREGLWELFDGPASFAFTDVDGQSYTVRLIGLREEWQKPADAPKVGAHSVFEVVLVEL